MNANANFPQSNSIKSGLPSMVTHIHAKTAQGDATAPEPNFESAPAFEGDPLDLMLEADSLDGTLFNPHRREWSCALRQCVPMGNASEWTKHPYKNSYTRTQAAEDTPGTLRIELTITSIAVRHPGTLINHALQEEIDIGGPAQLEYDPATKRLIIFAKGEK